MKLVNDKLVIKSLGNFKQKPFDYCIIDNFFPAKISKELCKRFPNYKSKIWHTYKNKIEEQKNFYELIDGLKDTKIQIDIYGEGSQKNNLLDHAKKQNVKLKIRN